MLCWDWKLIRIIWTLKIVITWSIFDNPPKLLLRKLQVPVTWQSAIRRSQRLPIWITTGSSPETFNGLESRIPISRSPWNGPKHLWISEPWPQRNGRNMVARVSALGMGVFHIPHRSHRDLSYACCVTNRFISCVFFPKSPFTNRWFSQKKSSTKVWPIESQFDTPCIVGR